MGPDAFPSSGCGFWIPANWHVTALISPDGGEGSTSDLRRRLPLRLDFARGWLIMQDQHGSCWAVEDGLDQTCK